MKPKTIQSKTPSSPTSKKRAAPVKKPLPAKKARAERVTSGERRTSGRQKSAAKYIETGDSTDDERMDHEDLSTEAEMQEIVVSP
jgi:hypothetical protein